MIEKLLFKPIVIAAGDQERLAILYNYETSIVKSIDSKTGTPISTDKNYVEILDIDNSIQSGFPVMESIEITDESKFLENVSLIDNKEVRIELNAVLAMIINQSNSLLQRVQSLSSAGESIKHSLNTVFKHDEGNLIIGSESGGLAHIVFNTIKGETAKLKEQDIEKIGAMIMDTMVENMEIDLENQETVDNFIGELEFKIIESLPQSLKAGDIYINREGLIEEMRACKEEFSSSDEDDEEAEDTD